MTILDAEYLEHTTFIDYNKAFYSNFMGYQLDNKKVLQIMEEIKDRYLPKKVSN